jgi:hypothetical protein
MYWIASILNHISGIKMKHCIILGLHPLVGRFHVLHTLLSFPVSVLPHAR